MREDSIAIRAIVVLALVLVGACSAFQPAYRDERFIIVSEGDFRSDEIQRVRTQLEAGAAALEKYIGPAPARRLPVVVHLRPGAGISHSHHGRGPIELYWVRERRAPIIHELTHVLAGYTPANGHWTQEGFASYMQDRYGEDSAFPTRKMAHALVKILIEDGGSLPMLEVMRDRDRARYFGTRTPWERWRAYTQATSFCAYLIERYGHEKFLRLYDAAFEYTDFSGIYGTTAEGLVAEWLSYLAALPADVASARATFESIKASLGPRAAR